VRQAVKDGQIQEVDEQEIDVELRNPSRLWSTHTNSIPMPSAVQVPRIFYGGRFFNQAVPLDKPEAAWVQNLDPESGQSFDRLLGEKLGAVRSRARARVMEVDTDHIRVQDLETGEEQDLPLYNRMPFNRFTALTQTPLVEPGQEVEADQVLARSNFTDDRGDLAMTVNARIGLVPYKGWSMDDAVVISQGMANKLTSVQTYLEEQEWDGNTKGGKRHFTSLFPTAYKKEVLEKLDDEGVAKVGTILHPGDPYILATRPRMFSSQVGSMGRMTRAMQQTRSDGSRTWDGEQPGEVVDVARTRNGVKVMIETRTPAQVGDKIVLRAGQKGVISKILSDEQVPRTVDGEPLEVLLNPLGLPSRANSQAIYEMLLGKIAKKRGEPIAVPAFTKPGEAWHELVQRMLDEEGIPDKEEVFDPTEQRKLENPITVGYAPVLKLQHMASKKISARGQGSYDQDGAPLKGGSDSAQSKRLSNLEISALMSSGAYANLREASTVRGTRNDEFWKAIRSGHPPPTPGSPFVWDKFQALLQGSGYLARDLGQGKMRLGPFTDARLQELRPMTLKSGDSVDPHTLEPVAGGLFDPVLVGGGRWGQIELQEPVPNPAFEKQIAQLLGIRQADVRRVVAGEVDLDEVRK
jgi:DNA-directed RNA polymerase subunit beta